MLERSEGMRPRRLFDLALEFMEDDPVLLLEGPRSVGKSTLLRQIAEEVGGELVDLDAPEVRSVVESDPEVYVPPATRVCVDEYQKAPVILDAIKARLNRETIPGQYVLTGSARYDSLPAAAQILTGRLSVLPVYPLSQGEIEGRAERFLETLAEDPSRVIEAHPTSTSSRSQYTERMVAGGMPLAFTKSGEAARNRWFDNYIRLTLQRDVKELSNIQQNSHLEDLLLKLAGQTAQLLNITKAASDARLPKATAERYLKLLEAVFLVRRLPAWGKTLRARVNQLPKIHIPDSGIAARLLKLNPAKLGRRDPSAMVEFGHLLETFTVSELMKQASWLPGVVATGHWRTHDQDEVDLVIELEDGTVLAFEVKAGARITQQDVRGLRKLRNAVTGPFRGVILYTGEKPYRLDEDLYAVPIDALWLV